MVLLEMEPLRTELVRLQELLSRAEADRERLLAEIDRLTAEMLAARSTASAATVELGLLKRSLGVRLGQLFEHWPTIKRLIIRAGNRTFPER